MQLGKRKKVKPKPKRIKALITKCDNIFSELIRDRDLKCLHCGSKELLQCSHLIPREHWKYRWSMDNAITLCAGCHLYGWHLYPDQYRIWLRDTYPTRYNHLMDNYNDLQNKPTEEDLTKLLEELNRTQTD